MTHHIHSILAAALAAAVVLPAAWRGARLLALSSRRLPVHSLLALAVLAVGASVRAARKGGRVVVSDPYIVDAGSYLTNDVAHVALAKRYDLLPDDTSILVYARQVGSTNAADWVRLDPRLTFAQHPHDYALPNATNHDVMVAAEFVPAPTVLTNGVWRINGFTIPGTGKAAFPNTKTIRKETP